MKKPLIILIVLHTLIPFAFAQQQAGNNPSPATHPKDTVGIGFDATRQMFQRRYQHPDAVPFDTLWKNNVYISLFGGMDKMIPRGNTDFNTGPVGGIAANWQFAPSHALRASLLVLQAVAAHEIWDNASYKTEDINKIISDMEDLI